MLGCRSLLRHRSTSAVVPFPSGFSAVQPLQLRPKVHQYGSYRQVGNKFKPHFIQNFIHPSFSHHGVCVARHGRSMFIQTEPTPNADALKFLPGQPVMGNGTREFFVGDDTRSSPLARSLLAIEGVKSVFFGPDFISINKSSDENWATMKPEIYSLLMEFFSTHTGPVMSEAQEQVGGPSGPADTMITEDDTEVVAMIKELLDTRVRPAIQEDGGDLEYKGFNEETGVVQVMLKGSCRGCDSSTVTLKNGIERMLMHYIPEVQSVEQVLSEEEKLASDEFEKFEARLRGGGKTVGI